jgi:NAD(P)-dependent dehydrogenase (short-subunit alcohol dehydrogenase family)
MKRIVVFGCSGDIGTAITKRVVASFSVSGVDMVVGSPDSTTPMFRADLRVDEDLKNACIWAQTGEPLWALVFAAGVYPIIPFEEYTLREWDETFDINVRSAFYACRTLAPTILAGGRIVLIASAAAHSGSRDIAYSSTKAALLGLTRSLAQNLAPQRILVNAICPGPIATQMSNRMAAEHKDFWLSRVPLGRFGTADEVAVAVEYLLEERNSFMTGTCLDIDGGLSVGR